jgi:hypothetical protein
MRGFYFIIIFSFLSLNSCDYHIQKNSGLQPTTDKTFDLESTVTLALVQQSVLDVCLRCHSGVNSPNLSSADGLRENIFEIQRQVESNQMPPSSDGYSPLGDCQKNILRAWVADGMPETSTQKILDLPKCQQETLPPSTATSILQIPLNYQTFTSQILQARCLHCHNADSGDPDASQILLYPFSALIAHRNLLGPDSRHSKLVSLVSRADDNRMPPLSESPLSTEQIEFIKKWVDAGHPEN